MKRSVWIVTGIAVLLIAVLNVILGMNLVPTRAIAEQRGTAPGWWLIWVVIVIAVICAASLGAFLVAAGLGKVPETRAK